MSRLQAHELYPGLIGRRVDFDGPDGSRISDELISIVAFAENESVYIKTKTASPVRNFQEAGFIQFADYWRIGWGVAVIVGEQMAKEPGLKSGAKNLNMMGGGDD